MHTVAAVGLMVDPRALGRAVGNREGGGRTLEEPTLYLYDHIPGGVGLASRLFHDERDALLGRTRALLEACPCDDGCPACVGPAGGRPRKALALHILDRLALRAVA